MLLRYALLIVPLVALAACQTPEEQMAEYRYKCAQFGHRNGSPEHSRCVEGLYRDDQNNEAIRDAARPHFQTCREEKDKKGRKTTYCY